MRARGDNDGAMAEVGLVLGDEIPSSMAASTSNPRLDSSGSNTSKLERRKAEGRGALRGGSFKGSSSC